MMKTITRKHSPANLRTRKFIISEDALYNACKMLDVEEGDLSHNLLYRIEKAEKLIQMVKPSGVLASTQIMALIVMDEADDQ